MTMSLSCRRGCGGLRPEAEMCGPDRDYAMAWIAGLERTTAAH
jgi:hypothetical protein